MTAKEHLDFIKEKAETPAILLIYLTNDGVKTQPINMQESDDYLLEKLETIMNSNEFLRFGWEF